MKARMYNNKTRTWGEWEDIAEEESQPRYDSHAYYTVDDRGPKLRAKRDDRNLGNGWG